MSTSLLPTGTEGQLLYNNGGSWTAFSDLYWNDTVNNFGIGTTSPGSKLTIASSSAGALQINPFGTSAGNTGEFRLLELAANGTNYTGFKSPDSLGSNLLYTLPSTSGVPDMVLTWQNGNVMQWKEVGGVGGVGDITQVGSFWSGAAFADTNADDQWLGLGADRGRINFMAETNADYINILRCKIWNWNF